MLYRKILDIDQLVINSKKNSIEGTGKDVLKKQKKHCVTCQKKKIYQLLSFINATKSTRQEWRMLIKWSDKLQKIKMMNKKK